MLFSFLSKKAPPGPVEEIVTTAVRSFTSTATYPINKIVPLDSTRAIVAWVENTTLYAAVASLQSDGSVVFGNILTVGTVVSVTVNYVQLDNWLIRTGINSAFIAWSSASTTLQVCALTVSGTTISKSSNVANTGTYGCLSLSSPTTVTLFYINGTYTYYRVFNLSGSAVASASLWNTAPAIGTSAIAAYMISSTYGIMLASSATQSGKHQIRSFHMSGTTFTIDTATTLTDWLGIAVFIGEVLNLRSNVFVLLGAPVGTYPGISAVDIVIVTCPGTTAAPSTQTRLRLFTYNARCQWNLIKIDDNHVGLTYFDSATLQQKLLIIEITATYAINVGDEYIQNVAGTTPVYDGQTAALDSTHFLFTYVYHTGSTHQLVVGAINISGTPFVPIDPGVGGYTVTVDPDLCTGCEECVMVCPVSVFELQGGIAEPVNEEECLGCESCIEACPEGAITIT